MPSPEPCDLLITHATILPLAGDQTVIEDGAVAVRGQRIAAVGLAAEVASAYQAGRVIDGTGRLLTPGFIDSHIHPSRYIIGGLPYRPATAPGPLAHGGHVEAFVAEQSAMNASSHDPDLIRAATLPLIATLIRNGTTAFLDAGGWNLEGVAQAVAESGIRATLTRQVSDLTPDAARPEAPPARSRDTEPLLKETADALARWHGTADGRIEVFTSGVWALNGSDALLGGLSALAQSHGVGMHLHVAGVEREDEVSVRWFGERTIPRLAKLGVLGPHFVALHAYFATDEDVRLLANAGAAVNQAPFGSALYGRGFGAARSLPRLRAAGIPVGLGTDTAGFAVSMFDVLRSALTVYRDATRDDLVLSYEDALLMATRDSARCLLRVDLGVIAPGYLADLVLFNVAGPRYALGTHPTPALALLAAPDDVETVIIDGRVVLDRGELTTLDEERLIAAAGQAARRFAAAR